MSAPPALSRRGFVQLAGAGLTLGWLEPGAAASPTNDGALPTTQGTPPAFAQPFLRIGNDGRVTVLAKHLDMGQGIWTGLASLVAEELDADWRQMDVEGAPADKALYKNLAFGFQTTGGSTSMANSYTQMRIAGATARALLVAAAAGRFGVAAAAVAIERGRISLADGRHCGFGELAAAAALLPVPASVVLKEPARFRLIGHATPRLDAVAKTKGAPIFAIDVQRPGMRVAVLQRAPRFGSQVKSFDASAARAVAGVLDVVQVPNGVAVLAEHTWAAMEGRRALRVEWDEAAAEQRSSPELSAEYRQLASGSSGIVCMARGDADAAIARASQVVEAEFESPYLAHAPMEPLCAVGEWRDGRCAIWAGIQNQSGDQAAAARILGLPLEQVVLHTLYAGGSFGRRATFDSDWISELAHLLKATGGATPIKLLWTREDDIRGGYYRPANLHRLRAAVAADGSLLALDHSIVAQSFLFGRPRPGVVPRPDPFVFEGHLASRYDVADARVLWVNPDVQVPVQMFRALAYNHTTFTKEVFIDELARRSGRDPLEYRLAHLAGHPRQAAVLRLAAERAGWGRPRPAGTALGIAVQQANSGTFVAQAAEVRIVAGKVRVDRVVCAIDCGLVVNPDIVRAQVEGGVAFGLSIALHGRITIEEGRTVQSNFHDYPVLRMSEMPAVVEVHAIASEAAPTGVGEPGSVPIVAAVANAVHALTGRPVRSLPIAL